MNLPHPGERPVSVADVLRRVFRRQAASVSVVTATDAGRPVGLLVTSLASVSVTPPLISFNVALTSSSWPALSAADHIGLHVLADEQEQLATRFATKGADRFGPPTGWVPGPHGVPLLVGVAAWGVARIEQRVPAGDHTIVVAQLLHGDAEDGATPLLHHDGRYHRAVPSIQRAHDRSVTSRLSVVRAEGA